MDDVILVAVWLCDGVGLVWVGEYWSGIEVYMTWFWSYDELLLVYC